MKKQSVMIIGGLIVLALCLGALLFPIGDGLVRVTDSGITEYFRGYDFIFTNDAAEITKEASGGMIAAWVLLIIGSVFGLFGTLLPLTGSTKFTGFVDILAGLCLIPAAVLLVLTTSIVELPTLANATYSLGYGLLTAAILAAVAGISEIAVGAIGWAGKKN